MAARASNSTARRWPTGRGAPPSRYGRLRAIVRRLEGFGQALRRRDARAGARSGPTQDQDRPAVGLCPRRPALGRSRAAGRRLCLRARPQARASRRASGRLRWMPPGRWLRRYKALAEGNAVTLAFCWAHARRNFFDIQAANPAPIAVEALARIGGLYAIERDIRGLGASARLAARQARARPISRR